MSASAPAVTATLPAALTGALEAQIARAQQANVPPRLREGDPTLWAPAGTPEVANRLGWLSIAGRMLDELPSIEALAAQVRDEQIADIVLLGMGGSSLAPEVLRRAFARERDAAAPTLHVLDSTDAARILAVQGAVDLQRTLFVVSSKSGGTIEPLSLFAHFFSLVGDGSRFVAITDPGSGLERLAAEHGFRHVFAGDPDIGGRYSALSPFGIVPAALTGIDVRALLEGASGAWQTPLDDALPGEALQAGVWLGVALSALARAGRDKLTFVISETLPGLGLWLEQLVAESTGKRGTGILPVADEPLGGTAAYGSDRVFAYLPDSSAPDAATERALAALAADGHPVITVPTAGPRDLGRLFLLAEVAVAAAGWGLEINPFDQPNVQQAKDATNQVLAEYEQGGAGDIGAQAPPAATPQALRDLLMGAAPPHYVALMAYTEPTAAFDAAAAELRAAIRDATAATTTFGYGPRFLHSTGQFHKGGPREGVFVQLLHDGPQDVEIPRVAYSFTTLKEAQAIGDLRTLRELGLPAERIRLEGEDAAGALGALTATIAGPSAT